MRFIGDVHGKFLEYMFLAERCQESIQVGDFGVGFGKKYEPDFSPEHRFIRGNHDNPSICKAHPAWIPDDTMENGVYFLGGADSIDKAHRIEGVSWWREEQVSQEVAWDITGRFANGDLKPRVMVTHDCPIEVAKIMFSHIISKNEQPSLTQQMLQSCWESHKPDVWIFGHWHESKQVNILGTQFICLGELDYIDIDLETLEIGPDHQWRWRR